MWLCSVHSHREMYESSWISYCWGNRSITVAQLHFPCYQKRKKAWGKEDKVWLSSIQVWTPPLNISTNTAGVQKNKLLRSKKTLGDFSPVGHDVLINVVAEVQQQLLAAASDSCCIRLFSRITAYMGHLGMSWRLTSLPPWINIYQRTVPADEGEKY